MADDPGAVIKVYRQPTPQKADKLRAMIRIDPTRMAEVAAWPRLLLTSRPGGEVVGFVMPRLTGFQPIQHLYNPAQRRKYFPKADWQSLLNVARNTATAFNDIHQLGCVVGDVNQSNLLVSETGRPKLIDCDSFQITMGGKSFCCGVGVSFYTPPELQSLSSLEGVVRTQNHDRFGIAVLIFQILFLGRHPYAGIFQGKGDPQFDQLIKEFRFAYGPNASRLQMIRPPHTPDLSFVPPEIGQLFERAFLAGSESLEARPTAAAWGVAIDKVRSAVTLCKANAGHKYSGHLAQCPWCGIMTASGPDYFVGVAVLPTSFQFDATRLNALVRQATQLATQLVPYQREGLPSAGAVIAEPAPTNTQEHRVMSRILGSVAGLGALVTLGGLWVKFLGLFGLAVTLIFGVWWAIHTRTSPRAREKRRRQEILEVAKSSLWRIEGDWIAECNGYLNRGQEIRDRIDGIRILCERLEGSYSSERRRLESNREGLAKDEHLRSQFIIDADIAGIGAGRKQTLASFNIETAFDIGENRILAIKGFGPALTNSLVAWRRQVLAEFRFDPKSGVPEADLSDLASRYAKIQSDHFAEIARNIHFLDNLVKKLNSRRREIAGDLTAAFGEWAQARADAKACS
jgi:DNA-binding helix-hairpin-helix protein with protein kinase domain